MRRLPDPLPISSADPNRVTFQSIRRPAPGSMYRFEHLLEDTVTYPQAGGAGLALPAFGNTGRGGDQSLSNWPVSGQLPKPHKFHGLYLFVTPLVVSAATVPANASGIVQDVETVWRTARTQVEFTMASTGRQRPNISLAAIPSLPGVHAFGIAGTVAAQVGIQQFAQIGAGDGYPFDLPLDEGETFGITLRTRAGGADPISAAMLIRISVYGWYYMQAG